MQHFLVKVKEKDLSACKLFKLICDCRLLVHCGFVGFVVTSPVATLHQSPRTRARALVVNQSERKIAPYLVKTDRLLSACSSPCLARINEIIERVNPANRTTAPNP